MPETWFANGKIVDLVIALMVVEALALAVYRSRTGRGVPIATLLVNLCAGGALLLALRFALVGASLPAIAASLAAALVFHLLDLALRWSRT